MSGFEKEFQRAIRKATKKALALSWLGRRGPELFVPKATHNIVNTIRVPEDVNRDATHRLSSILFGTDDDPGVAKRDAALLRVIRVLMRYSNGEKRAVAYGTVTIGSVTTPDGREYAVLLQAPKEEAVQRKVRRKA